MKDLWASKQFGIMNLQNFEKLFLKYMSDVCDANPDPSHDILHVQRVVSLAKLLAKKESANLNVVVPAAYLHDCVYISKSDNRRQQASRLSADKAIELLQEWKYPSEFLASIHHAVAAHSFSANIPVESLEAKIVQDADRLDAMGAIGIFRCFAFSGLAKRPLYSSEDPFCNVRMPNDNTNTLDHFFVKLLKLQEKLNTSSAKIEGAKRLDSMKQYLSSLEDEIKISI